MCLSPTLMRPCHKAACATNMERLHKEDGMCPVCKLSAAES